MIFTTVQNDNFQMKTFDNFYIFAQQIDFGYSLNCLIEAVLTSTNNLFILKGKEKINTGYPSFESPRQGNSYEHQQDRLLWRTD